MPPRRSAEISFLVCDRDADGLGSRDRARAGAVGAVLQVRTIHISYLQVPPPLTAILGLTFSQSNIYSYA